MLRQLRLLFLTASLLSICALSATAKPVVKSVKLPNRVTLEYAEQGNAQGLPVLFLHGYSDSWRSFELVLPHLPNSWHVFSLSQRGHGHSEKPATGYLPRDFAADVAAFMESQQLPRAVIVGHSMGSAVAQRFALDYPEKTRALVLVGSFTTVRGNAGVQELWDTTINKMTDPVDIAFVRDFQKSTLNQAIPQQFFENAVHASAGVPAHVWRAALAGLMETDFSAELSRITAPTLIIWGDRDAFFLRNEQDALKAAIKGAEFVIYPGIGHAPNWEAPQRFATDLRRFVKTLTQ